MTGTAGNPVAPLVPRAAVARAGTGAATGTIGDAAWLAALPAALVLLAAIVVLGPALGHALLGAPSIAFWPTATPTLAIRPEPVEHARYLLALAAPVAVAGLLLALARRSAPPRSAALGALVLASQACLVAFLVLTVVAQRGITYGAIYSGAPFHKVYFTLPTLAAAALLTVAAVAALGRETLVERVRGWTRETTGRRTVAIAFAALLGAAWLLTALNGEHTIRNANIGVYGNFTYWLDETFAVLDGRAPLVDFHAQYSQLWPYVAAALMLPLGTSVGAYAAIMTAGTALTLAAVFATLRRVVRSSLLALALFAPFVATSFFTEIGPPSNRYGPSNLFSIFPMRYAGAYLLAWLTVRHLDGARPVRRPLLFLVAGLVLVNNVEFGAPAFAATFAALLWGETQRSWARLARDAALGLLGAGALVSLLTLAVAGALPRPALLFTFSRLWGLGGVTMLPMPALGLHLAIYVTFAAAIVVATVRALAGETDVRLTALLAWAGVFGLGAGSYFAGRSHPEVLIDLFSAWAFALVLLVVVAVRAILARPTRRPLLAELAVLFGLGIAICSLAQVPAPWSQVERLGRTARRPPFGAAEATRAIRAATRPGERVAILAPVGHRIAYDLGIVNVSPYASLLSMPAVEQLSETIRVLRREGGHKVFVSVGQTEPQQLTALEQAGFVLVATHGDVEELRDGG
jgi:hypothetical protein